MTVVDILHAGVQAQSGGPEPANKLSAQEKRQILQTCNREEYSSLPPSQIVPALGDRGTYTVSEASFYRVLREVDQNYTAAARRKRHGA